MMSVNLEMLDALRQRANVSYAEAKEALEKCNNNLTEALIYLEKEQKVARPKEHHDPSTGLGNLFRSGIATIERWIKHGNETRVVISKDNNVRINFPVTIALLIGIFAPVISGIGFLAALMTNHKIAFVKQTEGPSANATCPPPVPNSEPKPEN